MQAPQKHLFQVELIDIVSSRYELAKLVKLIDWLRLEADSNSTMAIKALVPSLSAYLEYLKQIHKLSDENTVAMWCENQYW